MNLTLISTKVMPKTKSFPSVTSKELISYIEPTLKDGSFDTALIHVGVNDLSKKRIHSLDELVTNLRNIALKCCSFGVKNVYISGTVINNKYQTLFFKVLTQKLVRCVTGVLVDLLTMKIFKEYIYTKMVCPCGTWKM